MIHDNQRQNELIFIPVNVWQDQEGSLSKAAPPLFFFFVCFFSFLLFKLTVGVLCEQPRRVSVF